MRLAPAAVSRLLPLLVALFAIGVPAARAATSRSRSRAADTTRTAALAAGPRWALALSGGVARGLAHIGVLRALEEEHVRPDVVLGTSMGSLIGALWASGWSSDEIQQTFRSVDVQDLFEPHPDGYEWRRVVTPRPWLSVFGDGGYFRLPRGLLSEVYLDHLLVRSLLSSEIMASGNFDRLSIPWRAVATDMRTLDPVVLRRGSVARSVRASLSIPVIFPAVPVGDVVVVDGGQSRHLPIAAAHAEGVDHVLGVDVAQRVAVIDRHSDALRVGLAVVQLMAQRGREDATPGRDHVLWLEMPGMSPADFRLVDTLAAIGYHEAKPVVARLAREWNLRRVSAREESLLQDRRQIVAPLESVEWRDDEGNRARASDAADRLLGFRPPMTVTAEQLAEPLDRVHRADLFLRAWPHFSPSREPFSDVSTAAGRLTFEVQEHDPVEMGATGGWDADEGARVHLAVSGRPMIADGPAVVTIGAAARRFGREAYASLEPRSLARGRTGVFARGGARRTITRLFDPARDRRLVWTDRAEAMAGVQLRLPTGDVAQIGGGGGRFWSGGTMRDGGAAAVRVEAPGRRARSLDAVAYGGDADYRSARGSFSIEIPTTALAVRPSVFGGAASRNTPLDEWHGLGGPATMVGLHRDEWLGRQALGVELRLVRRFVSGFEADVYGQSGRVWHAIGRPDLEGRYRFAGGIGLRANVPFGPLTLDLGIAEGGARRFDLSFGPRF